MSDTTTPKRNRGIVVFFPELAFKGIKMKKGDELDCIEHNVPPAKMIQLIKARRIGYGDILRSHEEVMALNIPEDKIDQDKIDQDKIDQDKIDQDKVLKIVKAKRGIYNILDADDKPVNPEPIKGVEKAREYLEELKNG